MRHRARRPFATRALVVLGLTLGAGAGVFTTVSSMGGEASPSAGSYSAPGSSAPTGAGSDGGGSLPETGGTTAGGGTGAEPSATPKTAPTAAPSRRPSATGSLSPGMPSAPTGLPSVGGTSASTSQTSSPVSDRVAPETSLSSDHPTGRSAVFGFDANEPATFQCSLDGGAFESCVSPRRYTGLQPGWHTFSVRATDLAGNQDPSPAHLRWKATGQPAGPG